MNFEHVCTRSVEDFNANGPAKPLPGVGPVLCALCGYRKPKATQGPKRERAKVLGMGALKIARIECRRGTYVCTLQVYRQGDPIKLGPNDASDVRRIVNARKGPAFKGATFTARYLSGATAALSLNDVCTLVDVEPSTRADANNRANPTEETMKTKPAKKTPAKNTIAIARPDLIASGAVPDAFRDELTAKHGQTWSPGELAKDFETMSFSAPFVALKRRADGVMGVMEFTHSPRFYFGWTPKATDATAKAKAPKAAKIAPKAAPVPVDVAKAEKKAERIEAGHDAIAMALKSGPISRVLTFGYDGGGNGALQPEHLESLMDAAGIVLAIDTRANDSRGAWSRAKLREKLGEKYKAALSGAEVYAAIESVVARTPHAVVLLRKEEAPGDNDFHLEIARSVRVTHLFRNEIIEGADLQRAIDLDAKEGGDHEYDCEVPDAPSVAITAAPTQGVAAVAAS